MDNRKLLHIEKSIKYSQSEVDRIIFSNNNPQPVDHLDIHYHCIRSVSTLEGYATLDWDHVLDIIKLQEAIEKYYFDQTITRPLNIMMIADPGSGKSHFVKCLANSFRSVRVGAVTTNLSAVGGVNDLVKPIDEARNLNVINRLPILFLDEFDSSESNYPILLPLLWDGEIHTGNSDLKLGKAVIILAGSNPNILDPMDETNKKEEANNLEIKKLRDLHSRINGGFIQLSKSKDDLAIRVDKICICVALLLLRFGNKLEYVPWSLLQFIGTVKFRYNVRSMTYLIDSLPKPSDDTQTILSDHKLIPFSSSQALRDSHLSYHLIYGNDTEDIISLWNSLSTNTTVVKINGIKPVPFSAISM